MLLTISEIRSKSVEECDAYITQLITELSWQREDALQVINEVRASHAVEAPVSRFTIDAVLAFFKEHLEAIEWSFIYEDRRFCREQHKVFRWKYNNVNHYLIINPDEASNYFVPNLALLDTDSSILSIPTINELKEHADFNDHKDFLIYLGIIEGETPGILPTLSETLFIDESTARFSSALWFDKIQEKKILLAGLGGIGRFGNLVCFL